MVDVAVGEETRSQADHVDTAECGGRHSELPILSPHRIQGQLYLTYLAHGTASALPSQLPSQSEQFPAQRRWESS